MLLVLDANIIFSVLIKMGKTLELVFNSKFELVSPEFILEEFMDHRDEISLKSGLDYVDSASLKPHLLRCGRHFDHPKI